MNASEPPDLREYHARQRPLNAENEAQSAEASASAARRALRELEKCLLIALARLDEGDVSGARAEIEDALDRIERARVQGARCPTGSNGRRVNGSTGPSTSP